MMKSIVIKLTIAMTITNKFKSLLALVSGVGVNGGMIGDVLLVVLIVRLVLFEGVGM
jgi:hypothetical protein